MLRLILRFLAAMVFVAYCVAIYRTPTLGAIFGLVVFGLPAGAWVLGFWEPAFLKVRKVAPRERLITVSEYFPANAMIAAIVRAHPGVTLEYPLSARELATFAADLPCPIPEDVRELLRFCRGFAGVGVPQFVDLTGEGCAFEMADIFPHGLPIAGDGTGNFWVVDLWPESTEWGPIYFASHDPPEIVYQYASLEEFLSGDLSTDWSGKPAPLTFEECRDSSDAEVRAFAAELDDRFQVVDLRNAKPGDGFSWGAHGPDTVIQRHGSLPIFAYRNPKDSAGGRARVAR